MLPRRSRLTREQFAALLSHKGLMTTYNQLGTLKYISGKGGFSVVTSGKHEKRAVARNAARRRIYRLLREHSPSLSGILYLSKQSYAFDPEKIKTLFYELLQKTTTQGR